MNKIVLFEHNYKSAMMNKDDNIEIVVWIDKEYYQTLKRNKDKIVHFVLSDCEVEVNEDDGIYIE